MTGHRTKGDRMKDRRKVMGIGIALSAIMFAVSGVVWAEEATEQTETLPEVTVKGTAEAPAYAPPKDAVSASYR